MDAPPPYTEKGVFYNKGYEASVEDVNVEIKVDKNKEKQEDDPWALPDLQDTETPWKELDTAGKIWRVTWTLIRGIILLAFLYFFICSLSFLSDGFKLLGGKAAGEVFRQNEIFKNPIAGVMIGVLATVLVQSSSTTTSIVVAMVGGELLDVKTSIPIVMGANIGTSVTNTIVSLGQITNKDDFRRAFAGATVHDMFNWLAVIVLLPIEIVTGYLYRLSGLIVSHVPEHTSLEKQEYLQKITKPFTKLIVQVDSGAINKVAKGHEITSLLKDCCKKAKQEVNKTRIINETSNINSTAFPITTWSTVQEEVCVQKCEYFFKDRGLSDTVVGIIVLVSALIILCVCLFGIVKTLNSVLKGNIRKLIRKFINYEFPGRCGYFTGYVAILVGTGLTFLVQSSSIFTSTLTPLVGVGVVGIDRMYPLTLGANIGTTTTSILASLATGDIKYPLQVAMCHLFFNLSGILLFYPIPFMRFPIPLAKFLGCETAKYRWFALVYLFLMFFIMPAAVFGLSLAGWYVVLVVLLPVGLLLIIIAVIKIIQNKKPSLLPKKLQNWKFLPIFCRSLAPIDRHICGVICKCCNKYDQDIEGNNTKM